ncbi:MAG: 50S ribosomal protein L32 [Parcubacteria group bacterium]|nr:50S ribosomal protein L32 [Parcubacteria group bacterium]
MTIPRKHTTKSAQGQRRQHLRIKKLALLPCLKCGNPKMSHKACKSCGFYK